MTKNNIVYEYIAERTGSCPQDCHNWYRPEDLGSCEDTCGDYKHWECWKLFFEHDPVIAARLTKQGKWHANKRTWILDYGFFLSHRRFAGDGQFGAADMTYAAQPQLLQIPLDPGDVVYTPDWVARDMVDFFKPSGRILEPCKGDGVFLKYLPPHTEWCEIQEGRDFFKWSEPVDWIVGNPPYAGFGEFIKHSMTIA
jgi:hypothetical protein